MVLLPQHETKLMSNGFLISNKNNDQTSFCIGQFITYAAETLS